MDLRWPRVFRRSSVGHKSAEGYVNQFVVIRAISQPMREDVTTSCLIGWDYCRKSVCLLLLASHHLVLKYLWTAIDQLCGTAFEDFNFEPPGCVAKWYFTSISPKTFSVFRHEIQAICYHQDTQILMFVIICRLHAFISACISNCHSVSNLITKLHALSLWVATKRLIISYPNRPTCSNKLFPLDMWLHFACRNPGLVLCRRQWFQLKRQIFHLNDSLWYIKNKHDYSVLWLLCSKLQVRHF